MISSEFLLGRMRERARVSRLGSNPYYRGCLPTRKPRTPTHWNNTARPLMETTDSSDQPSHYGRPEIPGNHLSGDFTFLEYVFRALVSPTVFLCPAGRVMMIPVVVGIVTVPLIGRVPMILNPAW